MARPLVLFPGFIYCGKFLAFSPTLDFRRPVGKTREREASTERDREEGGSERTLLYYLAGRSLARLRARGGTDGGEEKKRKGKASQFGRERKGIEKEGREVGGPFTAPRSSKEGEKRKRNGKWGEGGGRGKGRERGTSSSHRFRPGGRGGWVDESFRLSFSLAMKEGGNLGREWWIFSRAIYLSARMAFSAPSSPSIHLILPLSLHEHESRVGGCCALR